MKPLVYFLIACVTITFIVIFIVLVINATHNYKFVKFIASIIVIMGTIWLLSLVVKK